MSDRWYADLEEVVRFGKACWATGEWDADQLWEYLTDPRRWEDEHAEWSKLGCPAELVEMADVDHYNDERGRIVRNRLERRYGRV